MRIQKGEIESAFSDLRNVILKPEEKQKWGEYLTKATYNAVVKAIKTEIEEHEGKRPKGETIFQLLEGREDMLI